MPGTAALGFVLAVLTCIGIWVLLYKTPLGFRIRAVGQGKDAAELAGINYKRLYVVAFFVSGALAAMGGFAEVNGVQHMLVQGFNPDIGAAGIGIAILANSTDRDHLCLDPVWCAQGRRHDHGSAVRHSFQHHRADAGLSWCSSSSPVTSRRMEDRRESPVEGQ
jgi:hypothetical protein